MKGFIMRKHKFVIGCAIATIILVLAVLSFGSTTFVRNTHSEYGKESAVEKLVVTITPDHKQDPCDNNDVNSIATSTDDIYGDLKRITISATGTDPCFGIDVNDSLGVMLFSRHNITTAGLPASYNLNLDPININSSHPGISGILIAGPLTIDANCMDPCNLTSVTVSIYYLNLRK